MNKYEVEIAYTPWCAACKIPNPNTGHLCRREVGHEGNVHASGRPYIEWISTG